MDGSSFRASFVVKMQTSLENRDFWETVCLDRLKNFLVFVKPFQEKVFFRLFEEHELANKPKPVNLTRAWKQISRNVISRDSST